MAFFNAVQSNKRVERATAPRVNQHIERCTEGKIHYYAQRPDDLQQRLNELDREWDIERTLQANAGITILLGLLLARKRKSWKLLSAISAAFMVVHAIRGWCPPLPVWRRVGVRTAGEINKERLALMALSGRLPDAGPNAQGTPAHKAREVFAAVTGKNQPEDLKVPTFKETTNVP